MLRVLSLCVLGQLHMLTLGFGSASDALARDGRGGRGALSAAARCGGDGLVQGLHHRSALPAGGGELEARSKREPAACSVSWPFPGFLQICFKICLRAQRAKISEKCACILLTRYSRSKFPRNLPVCTSHLPHQGHPPNVGHRSLDLSSVSSLQPTMRLL